MLKSANVDALCMFLTEKNSRQYLITQFLDNSLDIYCMRFDVVVRCRMLVQKLIQLERLSVGGLGVWQKVL